MFEESHFRLLKTPIEGRFLGRCASWLVLPTRARCAVVAKHGLIA